MPRRTLATLTTLVLGAILPVVVPAAPAHASLADGAPRPGWPVTLGGAHLRWSSPAIADIDGAGGGDVVIGGMNGVLYARRGDGSELWSANLGIPIASSPAVGDLDNNGTNEVAVGYGLETANSGGGVAILNSNGSLRCRFDAPPKAGLAGVFNSPAIGDVNGDGAKDVVFGSFNHQIYAINQGCGVIARFDNTDTVWSAPALYDVDRDSDVEIFIGGDATASAQGLSHSGGYYRSLDYNGTGTFAQRWVQAKRETFQSGGAIGDVNGDGRLEVVTGSGADYCRNQDPSRCGESQKVWAFHIDDGSEVPGWPKTAAATHYLAAPALGDVDGDGRTDVAIGTTDYRSFTGYVDLFYGNGGTDRRDFRDEIVAPIVIADVNGGGAEEVLVSGQAQLWVLNGTLDNVYVGRAAGNQGLAHKNAAAVGVLGGGWAVVSAGIDERNGNAGVIYAYDIPAPRAASWPMHRKNPRRLGVDPNEAAPIQCSAGYWLVATDGGIFSFGNVGFFGSTGNVRLNQPIVGMTARPDRSGYWFVARDGGIFSFGSAGFFGSTGDIRLNSPIVGMAATPSGNGYWLVAADGGIFTFGDAPYLGSMGGTPLNRPIVGMAASPTGRGYWLVASDGGIFNFGDAQFYGSTGNIRLNQPIVGMTAHPSGTGYWFVAADGGIFAFGDAPFHGSTGNVRLNRPINGMKSTPSGNGYWFVASDGGIFAFGDAEFCGSTGNIALNAPIVGMG